MDSYEKTILQWHGAAHYHIYYKNLRIVIDPIYTRALAAKPVLGVSKEDVDSIDFLLLTHAHVDHSWDFPYLASKHKPAAYVPEGYLNYLIKKEKKWGLDFDFSKFRALDQIKGESFQIADIKVTPYHIGTEKVDISVVYQSFIRGLRHMSFSVTPAGMKFLMYHLKENCFAFHFDFPAVTKSMLFFGNVTDQIYGIEDVQQVDVLALPYCPASKAWLEHTLYLIGRFNSQVILIHHYDNFWHPITHPRYRNLKEFRNAILQSYPKARLYFSKFMQKVDFLEVAEYAPDYPD